MVLEYTVRDSLHVLLCWQKKHKYVFLLKILCFRPALTRSAVHILTGGHDPPHVRTNTYILLTLLRR